MDETIRTMLTTYNPKNTAEATRAVREILQEIALVGLWNGKFFEHAAFYGGTALRILYGLDRFSEDLDFTLLDTQRPFSWHLFEEHVVEALSGYGFKASFIEKKKTMETPIRSAFLKTNTRHALLQIGTSHLTSPELHPDALIRIKVEIDSHPTPGFDTETIYLRLPSPLPIRALTKSSLFAGKTHAALYRSWKKRVKGRDWYDLVWFLRQGIPLNGPYLQACMHATGSFPAHETLSEEKLKQLLCDRIASIDLTAAKDDVRPFLRDPLQLEAWSVPFFHHWISLLKFEV